MFNYKAKQAEESKIARLENKIFLLEHRLNDLSCRVSGNTDREYNFRAKQEEKFSLLLDALNLKLEYIPPEKGKYVIKVKDE